MSAGQRSPVNQFIRESVCQTSEQVCKDEDQIWSQFSLSSSAVGAGGKVIQP